MKKFFAAFTIVLLFCTSCSSDDNSSTYFEFSSGEQRQPVEIIIKRAVKVGNLLAVSGTTNDDRLVGFTFDIYGNIIDAQLNATDLEGDDYYIYKYYRENYFNFQLIDFDESNKMVEVKYSGDLYENDRDLSSKKQYIEGRFKINYTVVESELSKTGVSAKINGENWYGIHESSSGGFKIREQNIASDDQYEIGIVIHKESINKGAFVFNENTEFNKVNLYEYNTNTHVLEPYETTGTFVITETNVGFVQTQIIGTFSFTASKDGKSIKVSEGKFNLIF